MKIYYILLISVATFGWMSCLAKDGNPKPASHSLQQKIMREAVKAAEGGLSSLKDYLENNHIDVNYAAGGYFSLLWFAIRQRNLKAIKTLLEAGANVNENEPRISFGWGSPLHWAIMSNLPQVVRMLLDYGAQIDIVDQSDLSTPLCVALDVGNEEIVRMLIGAGADVNLPCDINQRSPLKHIINNFTPDHLGVLGGLLSAPSLREQSIVLDEARSIINETEEMIQEARGSHSREEVQREGWRPWIGRVVSMITPGEYGTSPDLPLPPSRSAEQTVERQAQVRPQTLHVLHDKGKGKAKEY